MITEKDLQEAIAECVGQRNPTANTCIKLAAFYTIKQNLYPESKPTPQDNGSGYSYSGDDDKLDLNQAKSDYFTVAYDSGSEFSRTINSKNINQVFEVIDDTMDTLSVMNPRFYNSIMSKLSEI